MLKYVSHTGVRVGNLDKSVKFYKELGFTIQNQFEKPEPKAKVVTVAKGESAFELWYFEDSSHPYVQFIQNHIAVYSDDLENDVKRLEKEGYKIVIPFTEGVILNYVFLQDSAGTNYEIATNK